MGCKTLISSFAISTRVLLDIIAVSVDSFTAIITSGVCVLTGGNVTKSSSVVKMPAPIERCVRKQNILYLHNRNQFSAEYFRFMRRLLLCNIPHGQHGQPTADEKLVGIDVASMMSLSQSASHILTYIMSSR